MAKGSSQSQASSVVSRGGPGAASGAPPRGSAAASSLRRRRTLSSGASSAGGGGGGGYGNNSNMLRFYTDDAPGLKISPTVVLVMSLCFIGFVTALHDEIESKLREGPARECFPLITGNQGRLCFEGLSFGHQSVESIIEFHVIQVDDVTCDLSGYLVNRRSRRNT
ncbi:hypothetical protein R1sor_008562 [Riccia sorocarpa]|uniref:Protein transport protein Sec61 subunit beta n=1 Tax=Riccia sorocarpa TaxID=122646 RepID=A0ABD3HVW8_9MARC